MAKVPILSVLLPQLLCTLLKVSGQQSPCYEYFTYIFNPATSQVMGQIQIPSPPKNVELHLKVTLSIAVALPTNYVGLLKVAQSKVESVRRNQRDKPLLYHIYFPLPQPIPLLTGIWFNNEQYCSGPYATGEVVTSITLDHTLYRSSVLPPSQNPQPTVPVYTSTLDTPVQPYFECGIGSPPISDNSLISKKIKTSPGQWPWLVAIFLIKISNKFQCAGSILTQKHIITAARCLSLDGQMNISPNAILVSLGRYRLFSWNEAGSLNREIASYTLHPDYNYRSISGDSDLAILTLKTPVEFSPTIKPICMWYTSADLQRVVNKTGYVVGWGFGNVAWNEPYVYEPRMAKAPIVSQETCFRSNHDFVTLTSNRTFCAGMRDGSGPCQGDSGSGLMLYDPSTGRYRLRGIVSLSLYDFNRQTCDLTQYIVYVDVAKYFSWIYQQISM
ncbi:Serine protease gd [Camponotus japonicus]